jgi:protein-disulfide isomerase
MLRRFLVTLIRRSLLILLLICLGCSAQSVPPDLAHKIEHHVRAYYSVPAEIKVTVGNIVPSSELPGYDSVSVLIDSGPRQKDFKFLISKDRLTMLRVAQFDLTKDAFAELMGKIDIIGRPIRGDKTAKVVVVNFDDFECPFCSRMHETFFPEILREYGDRVAFVYKDFPLTEMHPWALHAAVDANCLAVQSGDAYWDFADFMHANKGAVDGEKTADARYTAIDRMAMLQAQKHPVDLAKLQACMKAQNEDGVRASIKEAQDLGIDATPTVYVNGQKISGLVSADAIRETLDEALREVGVPAPAHPSPPAAAPASK